MTVDEIVKELKREAEAFGEFLLDAYGEKAQDAYEHYLTVLKINEKDYEENELNGTPLWKLSIQDTEKYLLIMKEIQEDTRNNVIQVYKQYEV